MAYCVNCGVELGESEEFCPLCNTEVLHPKIRPNPSAAPYPRHHSVTEQRVNRNGIIIILTLVFLLPTSIVAMADVSINFTITWSGYVLGAFLFLYLAVVPPIASNKEMPVLFILIDAVCLALYLLFIEYETGGNWFYSLAIVIISGITLAVSVLITLARKAKLLGLRLFAFSLFAAALLPVLIEWRINETYSLSSFFTWSLYPFVVCIILGTICLVIDKNEPLKEKLARKFFL